MLAEGSALPRSVPSLLAHLTERWDGKGPLRRAKGEEIPLPMRIVHVAVDAAFQRLARRRRARRTVVGERAGAAFDPEVAACLADEPSEILALEPRPRPGTRCSPASPSPA